MTIPATAVWEKGWATPATAKQMMPGKRMQQQRQHIIKLPAALPNPRVEPIVRCMCSWREATGKY
jgi:hypothetical protein